MCLAPRHYNWCLRCSTRKLCLQEPSKKRPHKWRPHQQTCLTHPKNKCILPYQLRGRRCRLMLNFDPIATSYLLLFCWCTTQRLCSMCATCWRRYHKPRVRKCLLHFSFGRFWSRRWWWGKLRPAYKPMFLFLLPHRYARHCSRLGNPRSRGHNGTEEPVGCGQDATRFSS